MSSTEIASVSTRERILRATWELMEAHRGQGVRIEEIAQAAKVSRQAVYLHFGSRPELLMAAARYIDESLGLSERIQDACNAGGGVISLEQFVKVWADYIPEIYGLAKAFIAARETDEAARAAWNDRMGALHAGCRIITARMSDEGILAAGWTVDEATDFVWSSLSIQTWENLTVERGWTQAQYIERTQAVLRQVLLKAD